MKAVLQWSPNTESDIASYNVYRSYDATAPAKITQVTTPAYSENLPVGQYTVSFQVTAVDKAGNESTRSAIASMPVDLNPPQAPTGLVLALQ